MRNSPWSLLVLAASIVTLTFTALFLPTLPGVHGRKESAWDLLLEWQQAQRLTFFGAATDSEWSGILRPVREDEKFHILLQTKDQDGLAVHGAKVVCDRIMATSTGRVVESQTKDDGYFHSPRLEAGNYIVTVSHPGFLPTPPLHLTLPLLKNEVQSIPMQAGCVVSGWLNGTDGVPRNHGFLVLEQKKTETVIQIKPDVNGTFTFPAVAEGDWILSWKKNATVPLDARLQGQLRCRAGQKQSVVITLLAADLRVPQDPSTLGVGVHTLSTR